MNTLDEVRRKLKLPRFSLGGPSEACNVFDPSFLEPLIAHMAGEVSEAGAAREADVRCHLEAKLGGSVMGKRLKIPVRPPCAK